MAKLKDTLTGDTLVRESRTASHFRAVQLPEPSIAYAISAKTRNDEDRMGAALHKILEEDQSLRFYRDPQTKEFLLAGNGQQHVEIVVSRLKRRYSVDVELQRAENSVSRNHSRSSPSPGAPQEADRRPRPVRRLLDQAGALPRGEKFEFANEIFGGSIPEELHSGGGKGHRRGGREQGYLAGFPVVDFKVTVYDGSYHDVDSSEMAFKLAARKAFKAAMQQANPALLEPVMNVEVQAPVEYAGDLMGDLNGRRGRISGMDLQGRHAGHPRPGADVGDAELSERPDLNDAGPGVVPHGVRPLRLRSAAAGGEDYRLCEIERGASRRG